MVRFKRNSSSLAEDKLHARLACIENCINDLQELIKIIKFILVSLTSWPNSASKLSAKKLFNFVRFKQNSSSLTKDHSCNKNLQKLFIRLYCIDFIISS